MPLRPRKQWIDDVEEDVRTMGVRGWRRIVNDRTEWKKLVEQAKTHIATHKATRRNAIKRLAVESHLFPALLRKNTEFRLNLLPPLALVIKRKELATQYFSQELN
ncbi:hypothetical protein L798_04993 [Zootermopsis nevadensis]|uniref:Uncharacterized protein n=1 Tax=Zootermopsis nevadensis TaxID=136037 RepID=A0A067RCE5_ZOONE|nr:hypothetical protein L798_04993 [Zootermopsis nevadensis]